MRNQDRSLGYFILLLLVLTAGAVRLDPEVPAARAGQTHQSQVRPSLVCSPADAAANASFCSASPALAWTDS